MHRIATLRGLALLAFLVLLASDAAAQAGSYALWFQTTEMNARSRALGETGLLLRGSPGVAMLNPAAIGRPYLVQARGGTAPWTRDGMRFSNVAVDYATGRWAVASQVHYFLRGKHEKRDASNRSLGTVTSYDVSASVSGAYRVTPDFSVGLGLRYLRSDLGLGSEVENQQIEPASTLAFDLGLHYRHARGNDDVRVRGLAAWSLTDVGDKVRYVEIHSGDPLPTTMRGGLGVELEFLRRWLDRPLVRLGLYGAASKRIVRWDEDAGEAYTSIEALVTSWRPLDIDYTVDDRDDGVQLSAWDQLMWHRGMELALFDVLALRWGRRSEADALREWGSYGTIGWGVDLFFLAFDTSVTRWGDENWHIREGSWSVSTITARVPLGGEAEGNFWPELLELAGW